VPAQTSPRATGQHAHVRARRARRARALAPVLAGAAAALLALAGCGGGSSGTTKAQYVKQVNSICAVEQQQLTQAALERVKLSATLDHANSIREQTLAKIEAVKSPHGEAISPEWLQLRRRALSLAKKIAAAGIGSRAARPLNAEYVNATNKAERLGAAYGLNSCRRFAAV
jgi:hypothetical protein